MIPPTVILNKFLNFFALRTFKLILGWIGFDFFNVLFEKT